MAASGAEISAAENSVETAPKKKVIGRPFEPGKSGNPGGRPKNDYRAILAVRAFEILCEEGKLDKSAREVSRLILRNPKMFQVAADGAFGKVPQTINLQGEISVASRVEERLRSARKRA